uniref:Uncharacterized protein n=1 Tax=Anopheles atroparvus TaxID=41427 RepID=A0A182IXA6_ANOAO
MDKPSRPVRNRKRSRKAWPPGDTHRPVKRLFTPEIKRMLKDWLVRRRENPYPNREEKKLLAHETGLTYTQICNWFANWRRKLKNSGNDPPTRKTWGNLIKNYNTNARGNVEQFSICSSDSIWGEHGVEGGEDSRDSRSPDSSGEEPQHGGRHVPMGNGHRQGAPMGYGSGGPVAFLNYAPRGGGGRAPYEAPYGGVGHNNNNNNNSEQCSNNNLMSRKYVDYVRLPEFERLSQRNNGATSPHEEVRDTYPAATFCFDHCYTPRNYETVFGIPEETRCYKVTQIDGKYVPETGTTLEPLILTTATAYPGHPYGKEGHTNGTLYLTPTTTISPATPIVPAVPGVRSRSSKYKNSIMEKYLRDLGELEATEPERTVVPVLMAAIPFQQAHYHHRHHTHEYEQNQHPPTSSPELAEYHHLAEQQPQGCQATVLRGPPSLSKWLESTAKFTPSKHNYIDWDNSGKQSSTKKRCDSGGLYGGPPGSTRSYSPSPTYGETVMGVAVGHQKDEIDAAEALTRLANNFRTKFTT